MFFNNVLSGSGLENWRRLQRGGIIPFDNEDKASFLESLDVNKMYSLGMDEHGMVYDLETNKIFYNINC